MTLRESIARQKRIGAIVTYVAFAVCVVAMVLSVAKRPGLFVAVLGFSVSAAGLFYLRFFVRCPRCRGEIGYVVSTLSSPFSISRRIRFCPFCGVALDSEVETRRAV